MKTILAINGSIRSRSSNGLLINYIQSRSSQMFGMDVYNELASLPHFSPDIDNETPPETITGLRAKLTSVNGIFICTPEYAHGVPGSLKNAIDWTVSSMELYNKPVALITASSSGQHGHTAMIEILSAVGAYTNEATQLLIPFIKTKFNAAGELKDPDTIDQIDQWLRAFDTLLNTPHE